jgi:hypothetical protein
MENSKQIPKEIKDPLYQNESMSKYIGNSGREYYMVLTGDNSFGTHIGAYTMLDGMSTFTGSYSLERTNGTSRNPSFYLELPEFENYTVMWLSDILIYKQFRGDGIANDLTKVLTDRLHKKGGVHVVTFNDYSEKARKKFLNLGYSNVSIRDEEKIPRELKSFRGWVYKKY